MKSKTVRMPSDLVEFIESCPCGNNFSQKLFGILEDYRNSYDEKHDLEELESLLLQYREICSSLVCEVNGLNGLNEVVCRLISRSAGAARADPPAADSVTGVNGVVE